MNDHPHHHQGSELGEMQLRVRALETILTEKGYVDPRALDLIIEAYETKIGPHNGARADARAARPCEPRRRPSGRGREHAAAPQHGRVHAVLLLSVGDARPAAGLVQ